MTHEATTTDLLGSLQDATVMDEQGYTLDYPVERPRPYIFVIEPQPYWEPVPRVSLSASNLIARSNWFLPGRIMLCIPVDEITCS